MQKIFGIFIATLFITSIVLPVYGIKNDLQENNLLRKESSYAEWSMTYGGDEYERLYCVHETDDGGYIACGQTKQEESYRPWVLKVDSQGGKEWEWTLIEINDYAGHYFNYFHETRCSLIKQTSDGGYLLCFYFKGYIPIGGDEYYPYHIGGLIKLNSDGSEDWHRYYIDDLEWVFIPSSFIEINDGEFILIGYACDPDPVSTDYEAGLMKIDANGENQWYKGYNYGDGIDVAWAICTTNDNGYLLTGYAEAETSNDYWMIKTDINGEIEWGKTYGGDEQDYGHPRNCFQTNDGGFIMCGYSYSFGAGKCDLWIVKTDSLGDTDWVKTYGGSSMDVCWSMEETTDGYVFCVTEGYDRSSGNQSEIHLVKTDDDGNIIWIQEFGGEGWQIGSYIDKTSDGGYIVAGRTGRHQTPFSDGLLVKFAPFENERPNKPEIDGPSNGKPDNEYTFTSFGTDPDGDSLTYMWDWGDGNLSEIFESSEASYTWTYEDNFEVRVMVIDEHGGESDWSDPFAFSTPRNKNMNLYPIMIWRLIKLCTILKLLI